MLSRDRCYCYSESQAKEQNGEIPIKYRKTQHPFEEQDTTCSLMSNRSHDNLRGAKLGHRPSLSCHHGCACCVKAPVWLGFSFQRVCEAKGLKSRVLTGGWWQQDQELSGLFINQGTVRRHLKWPRGTFVPHSSFFPAFCPAFVCVCVCVRMCLPAQTDASVTNSATFD